MSNSPLATYVRYSPYHTKMSNKKITTITPHHVAGIASVEAIGSVAQTRGGAANYGIGNDGRIGLYIDESNRSHASSSAQNDAKAVTIEVSNSATGGDWPISDKAMESLINLCVDICKRNKIPYLNYTGDTTGNLTMHAWFGADSNYTGCPGQYLASKFPYIAREVNKKLGTTFKSPEKVSAYERGDCVKIAQNALYYNNYGVPSWLKGKKVYIRNVFGKYYDVSVYETGTSITGRLHEKYLLPIEEAKKPVPEAPKKEVEAEKVPETPKEPVKTENTSAIQPGDEIILAPGAVYTTGRKIPEWVYKYKLYARDEIKKGIFSFSMYKTGAITGYVDVKYLTKK